MYHTYVCMYVRTYVRTYVCMCVCVYVCMCVCIRCYNMLQIFTNMVLQILTIPNLEFRVSLNHPLKNKIVNPKPSSYIGVGYSHFRKAHTI